MIDATGKLVDVDIDTVIREYATDLRYRVDRDDKLLFHLGFRGIERVSAVDPARKSFNLAGRLPPTGAARFSPAAPRGR